MICRNPRTSLSREDILKKIAEKDILGYYLGISTIPCTINSPLRKDNNASFGLDILPDGSIYYKDFATGETGGAMSLLMKKFNKTRAEVYKQIEKDLLIIHSNVTIAEHVCSSRVIVNRESSELKVRIKSWDNNSIKYWEQFGIDLDTLKRAKIYPISHIFIIKKDKTYCFKADKLAFVFVEFKEGKYTYKVYQPYNKLGYKWRTNHARDTLGLYRMLPKTGNEVCICSSVKDALCLYCNLGIPTISLQGEGMMLSDTIIKELKERFNKVYILLDSDEVGRKDAIKLSKATNYTNIQMTPNKYYKDIAEAYQYLGKEKFCDYFKQLFNN